jgi:hypothetical protein
MGVVWRGEDTLLRRPVAVKAVDFPPSLTEEERASARARLLREARSAARLGHPGAVTVFDVAEESGHAYIVMELVEAPTLAGVVESSGPLTPRRAARIGLDVLGILQAAHAVGIVHRDVKPANVMVPAEGPSRLTDFGIAFVKDDPRLTSTGLVLGSPAYMSPEQAQGRAGDEETDLWGLGATLYYALEGRPPFERGQSIATLTAVVQDEPEPPSRAGALAPVILGLLSKDPSRRPRGGELQAALEAAAKGDETTGVLGSSRGYSAGGDEEQASTVRPASVRRTAPPLSPGRAAGVERSLPRRRPPAPRHRARGWRGPQAITLALVLLLAAAVVALVAWGIVSYNSNRPSRTERAAEGPGAAATPSASESPPGTRSGSEVPAGWQTYTSSAGGFTIAYPPGWSAEASGTEVMFSDPAGGRYAKVAWREPASPRGPVGEWRSYSQEFAALHEAYREIRIEPARFRSFDAAIWEFEYTEQGARLHAIDLAFVTPGNERGYALYFQTHADQWNSSQALLGRFMKALRVHA